MITAELGKQLFALCKSEESEIDAIKGLLESLNEDQRRKVVRFKDKDESEVLADFSKPTKVSVFGILMTNLMYAFSLGGENTVTLGC